MLARRRHTWVDHGGDDHIDIRSLGEIAVLGLVVGPLDIIDARADRDRSAQVCAYARQACQVGEGIQRQVDLAG